MSFVCSSLVAWASGCAQDATPYYARSEAPSEREREVIARSIVEDANELLAEERIALALMATARGLRFQPENPALLRLRAHLLERAGGGAEAPALRARADALDPPPPPLPLEPLTSGGGRRIVLLPPPELQGPDRDRVPREWPQGAIGRAIDERLRLRLPGVTLVHAGPRSIDEARALLGAPPTLRTASLRVERAFFGSTRKDGSFAVAWLRVATDAAPDARPGFAPEHEPAAAPGSEREATDIATNIARDRARTLRGSVDALRDPADDLRVRAIERTIEDALLSEPLDAWLASATTDLALAATGAADERSHLRRLFPGIEAAQRAALESARAALRGGSLRRATGLLREAAAIDPGDPDTASLLADVEATLALSAALDERDPRGDDADLPLQLSSGQRTQLEDRLAEERERRILLLGSISALSGDLEAPSEATLAALRDVSLGDPEPFGAKLARERGAIARVAALLTPDGTLLARFYFGEANDEAGGSRGAAGRASDPAAGTAAPVLLREDDSDADGRPDRWVAFDAGATRESWLDRRGRGRPDVHWLYRGTRAEPALLEIDADGDGRPEQVFAYRHGQVREQWRDRDGDGRFEVFEFLDAEGVLARREEDLNRDGEIDLRSFYQNGRLQRREFAHPTSSDPGTQSDPGPTGFEADRTSESG